MFHRVTDIEALPAPTFFRLAWRLPAYAGVMQARMQEAFTEPQAEPAAQQPFTYNAAPRQDINPGTKATLMADPAFQGIFSFG